MTLDDVLHMLPRDGAPSPLYVYLHGAGATALAMVQVADRFAQSYPQAAHLIPDGFVADDAAPGTRRWFPGDVDDASTLAERVAAALPALVDFVRDAQRQLGVTPPATALVGFSQGAIVALEVAQAHPGLVGRVVAIGGRYATLPSVSPTAVIHMVQGKDDATVPARHVLEAATRLLALGADVTADVVPGIGHAPHPALVERALGHLQTFLPRRIWAEALASAPLVATRADSRDLERPVAPPAANDPS
jgi:phospholipase/carboxylesterase